MNSIYTLKWHITGTMTDVTLMTNCVLNLKSFFYIIIIICRAFWGPVGGGYMNEALKFPWSSTIFALAVGFCVSVTIYNMAIFQYLLKNILDKSNNFSIH